MYNVCDFQFVMTKVFLGSPRNSPVGLNQVSIVSAKSKAKIYQQIISLAFILKDFTYLIQPYRGVSWGARKYSSH